MRRLFTMFILLLVGLSIFTGCANTSEYDAEQVAKTFVTQCYDIDYENSTKQFNSILESLDNVELEHEKFKPIMKEKALERFIANRTYLRLVQFSVMHKCSVDLLKIDLNKRTYDKEEGKISYDYTVSFNIVYENNSQTEEGVEEGYISLILEENDWKVDSHKINKMSEAFIKIN